MGTFKSCWQQPANSLKTRSGEMWYHVRQLFAFPAVVAESLVDFTEAGFPKSGEVYRTVSTTTYAVNYERLGRPRWLVCQDRNDACIHQVTNTRCRPQI